MATLSNAGLPSPITQYYLPVLNSLPGSAGLKVLALAHTLQEGFYPGSKAFKTNNPGNIGTTAVGGTVGKYATLKDGVQAQLNYFNRILSGSHRAYPAAGNTTLKGYVYTYAPPIENNSASYVDFMLKQFAKQGYPITANTTLSQIAKIGLSSTNSTNTDAEKKK